MNYSERKNGMMNEEYSIVFISCIVLVDREACCRGKMDAPVEQLLTIG